jgi:hypothetical protein
MKTLFLATAALAALVIGAPIGAHAEYVHGWVNGQYFHGTINNGPSGFGAGFAQGWAAVQGDGPSSAPTVTGHKYWMSFDGEHHDCSYDPPNPLAVAFGAKCRMSQ